MPQTFNDVKIDGNADVTQLTIEGHTTQTQPLQTWQDSAGNSLGQVTGDGRLTFGDSAMGAQTDDSIVEAHRSDTSTKPKRGFHSLGRVVTVAGELLNWSVHELELMGSTAISTLQTALRVRLTNNNSANSGTAELRAADIEADNAAGTINKVTAVQATVKSQNTATISEARGVSVSVTKAAGATIGTAYGIKVEDVNDGTNKYALHTGVGMVHLGDTLELKAPAAVPSNPVSGEMRVYPKTDGKLYAKNDSSQELVLTNPTVLADATLSGTSWSLDLLNNVPYGTTYTHLELHLLARTTFTSTNDWISLYYNTDSTYTNYYLHYFRTIDKAQASVTGFSIANVNGASSPTDYLTYTRVFIPFYRLSSYKKIATAVCNLRYDAASMTFYNFIHHWQSASGSNAIDKITLQTNDLTSQFTAGSRIQVLGYKL